MALNIKVPFCCEWIFALSNQYGDIPLHGYLSEIIESDGVENAYLSTRHFALPGFLGIKYYLDVDVEQIDVDDDNGLMPELVSLNFNVEMDYKKYDFDADFVYYINDGNRGHTIANINNTKEDGLGSFNLCQCPGYCGCNVCSEKRMVVRVEGTFTIKFVDALPIALEVSSKNKTLFNKNAGKDVVIAVEEQEIRVHKSVLIQNSTIFATMFDSDKWKETKENKIIVPNFSYKVVEIAVNACYGKVYDKPLSKEEYLMLFQFADKYDMKKLKEAAKQGVVFTPHNVVQFANYFLKKYCDELLNCCIDYILACSQYSVPIKDSELLDVQIRAMFFDRALASPVLKNIQNLKIELLMNANFISVLIFVYERF